MTMEDCDVKNYTLTLDAAFRFTFDSFGVFGSIVLLVIMKRTSTLKGFSGILLLNEQVACLVEQILSIVLNLVIPWSLPNTNTVILSCIQTVKNVSLLLLLAINCTLYTAICKGLAFKRIWTWTKIFIVVVISWVSSIPLGMAPIFSEDYFTFDCDAMYPFPSESSYWRLIIYIFFCCVTVIINIVLLYQIVHSKLNHQPSKNLRAFSDSQRQVKLALFVFLLSIFYSITYVGMYSVWYAKIAISETKINVGLLFNITVYLNKTFLNFRIFFYMFLYRPIWMTVKSTFSRLCRNQVQPVVAHEQLQVNVISLKERTLSTDSGPILPTTAAYPMDFMPRDACAHFGEIMPIENMISNVEVYDGTDAKTSTGETHLEDRDEV